ncbi:FAD-dependent oxidoreductase, partial [Streptococcus suis]
RPADSATGSRVDDLRALTARVEAAKSSASGVTVITDDVTVRARFAILALAPVLYPRISFEPPLPRKQHQMHQHISMGFVIKVHAVYDRPFWREQGL